MDFFDMTEEDMDKCFDEVFKRNKDKILEMFIKEIEELKNKETKQHKSLSDYRVYEELEKNNSYKFINHNNYIDTYNWCNDKTDKTFLSYGNVYSIDTPDELLEREIKKRKLWFNLEKHLKENNCLATSEDWKDSIKPKFCIRYSHRTDSYVIDYYNDFEIKTIYSTNEDVMQEYMNTLTKEDIKIMFDVNIY